MKKTINVTARDIKRGCKNMEDGRHLVSESCPITLAAKRIFKGFSRIATGHSILVWNNTDNSKEYKIPKKAIKFIDRFDTNKSVRPFKFTIEV